MFLLAFLFITRPNYLKSIRELPSDATLSRHLIMEKGFNPDAVNAFIKDFRDTIAFAKLDPSDKISVDETVEGESEPQERVPMKTVEEAPRRPAAPTDSAPRFAGGSYQSATVIREFNFPLPGGVASLKVPFPLSEEDFTGLLNTLQTFKDGLVKKPDPVTVDSNSEKWQEQAKAMAEMQLEFSVLNFDYSQDAAFLKDLAKQTGFDVRVDFNKHIAFFKKRTTAAKT